MAVSIKNEETSRAITKLSEATGLSLTEAVRVAVEEKLERIRAKSIDMDRVMEICRDAASRMPKEFLEGDPDDLLYDENGLPK